MIKIYHNPKCRKSREAIQLLNEEGKNYEVVEYLKATPTVQELREISKLLGMKPESFIRKGEKIYKEKFAGKNLTDEEWYKAIAENPILLERPIVVKDQAAAIGRPLENVKKIL